ncbi:MAG: hypothetical protein JRJ85_24305, partial [Deltaproteobacteria bacterium]|nr:hypothetical protein [Deltaproteobacteria bacterium]
MAMKPGIFSGVVISVLLMTVLSVRAAEESQTSGADQKPKVSLAEDMGKAMRMQAAKVKKDLKQHAQSLFEREPLGWDLRTFHYLYRGVLSSPGKIPEYARYVIRQGRVMDAVGFLLFLIFLAALIYSPSGQRRAFRWVENKAQPYRERIPRGYDPFLQSGLRVVLTVFVPLVFLGLFSLIKAMVAYRASWFELLGHLLGLWAAGALILQLLKELLNPDILTVTVRYGKMLLRSARLVLFYVIIVIALFWAVEAFRIRADVLSLLKFLVSLSIAVVLFQLFLRKDAVLSLFPDLTYRGYRVFFHFFRTYYYPLIVVSFLSALLWCFGYKNLGQMLLTKIWFTAMALMVIILVYYALRGGLGKWADKLDSSDESAQLLVRSLKTILLYAAVIVAVIVVLNLLGLLSPLKRILSFHIFQVGMSRVSLWIMIKAVLILLIFIYASRLLQAYLDYKIYPRLGIDPGLGYALNTFF